MTTPRLKLKLSPRLVAAIDIGTTSSAVSFYIQNANGPRNALPRLDEVNRWPTQEVSDGKVPSVLYYDGGIVQLCGAETSHEPFLITAEDRGWQKAEWWKLHLRPDYLEIPGNYTPEPLPEDTTLDGIYTDYFMYIKKNLCDYISNSYGQGSELWDRFSPSMHIILTTPNGWDGRQQNRMREAAVLAGLVNGGGGNRIRFVSEGEAAVHYALNCGKFNDGLRQGNNILVCDAGGGTSDISTYQVLSLDPLVLEEISSPACYFSGAVFVNVAARDWMSRHLTGSQWDNPDIIELGMRHFEQHAKRTFDGSGDSLVRLDGLETNPKYRVNRGRLTIPCEIMESFFKPLVSSITNGMEVAMDLPGKTFKQVIVVGGFTSSPYVFSKLEEWGIKRRISITKPDGPMSKAITQGGLIWQIYSSVRTRIAKFHYGAEVEILFDPTDAEMVGRKKTKNVKGEWRVRNAWGVIVPKDDKIRTGDSHNAWFHKTFTDSDDLEVEMQLYAYRFAYPPKFIRNPDGTLVAGFIHICSVKGNLEKCFKAAEYQRAHGKRYKYLQYETCLHFDDIELRASLRWKGRRDFVSGEAMISYDV